MLRARRLAPCPAVPSIMPTGLTSSLPFHSGSFQKSTDFRRPTASIRTNDRPAASTASSNKSVHALRSGNLTRLLGSSELSVLWCPVDRTSGVWLIGLQLFGPHVLVVAPRTEQGIAVRLEVSYGLPGAGGFDLHLLGLVRPVLRSWTSAGEGQGLMEGYSRHLLLGLLGDPGSEPPHS